MQLFMFHMDICGGGCPMVSSHCPLYKAGIYVPPSFLILFLIKRLIHTQNLQKMPRLIHQCHVKVVSAKYTWERGVINDKTKVQIALIKLMNTR